MSNVKRFKKNHFTITDNKLIKDDRLSWKARGIFIYLWSMPDDWNFYVDEVAKHSKDGIKALKSGLSELEKYGYLKRTMLRDERGLFGEMSWKLSDTGVFTVSTKNGPTDNTVDAKNGPTDNGTLLNKNNTNKKEILNKKNTKKSSSTAAAETGQNAFELYQIVVGILTPMQSQNLSEYIRELSDDVVKFAINSMANQTEQRSFNYLNRILMKYEQLGIDTVEKAEALEKEHQAKKKPKKKAAKRQSKPSEEWGGW